MASRGGKQGAQTASSPSVLVKKILREQFKDAGKKYQRKHRRKKSQVIQGKGKLKKKKFKKMISPQKKRIFEKRPQRKERALRD